MERIYISGHTNPDTDSVCSAWAYARLKRSIDHRSEYQAIRCGPMNQQTKHLFRKLGVKPPRLKRDVYPRAQDVARLDHFRLDVNEPIHKGITMLDSHNLSIIPVFNAKNQFRGTFSTHELANFSAAENEGHRPQYIFRIDNFDTVIPGKFYRRGNRREFKSSIMTGAMPYKTSIDRLNRLTENPVLIVGLRKDLLTYAVENQLPALILTGIWNPDLLDPLLEDFEGSVYLSKIDTAETIRLLRLSIPIKHVMNNKPTFVDTETLFDEAKEKLVNSDARGLPVLREGEFSGIVTRRCFIERPRPNLILVDHNEIRQSIPGAEQSKILEIIDHHRLAPEKTQEPIYVYAKPVGSTCTIVYQEYRRHGINVDRNTATILLAGILSDTVILKSPTTTEEDIETVHMLARLAEVDYQDFGTELFRQSSILTTSPAEEAITSDFKQYDDYGMHIGIGQVETITLEDLNEKAEDILTGLENVRAKRSLDIAMLLVSDVMKGNSVLLTTEHHDFEHNLIYKQTGPHQFQLPGVLSRKKQLLPEVLRVIEELSQK